MPLVFERVGSSNEIVATPGLRLPARTIQFRLRDAAGTLQPRTRVTAHVMSGGGGFRAAESHESAPRRSSVVLETNDSGEVSLPEFVLGPQEGPNQLLVQTEGAHVTVPVRASYTNTWLEALRSDPFETVARGTAEYALVLLDRTFQYAWGVAFQPTAMIQGTRVSIEITAGGGWIDVAGRLLRAAILRTNERGRIEVRLRASSRAETMKIKAYLLDAPQIASEEVALQVISPGLINGSPFSPNYTIDVSAQNLQRFDVMYRGSKAWDVDVVAKDIKGGGTILPEVTHAVDGLAALTFLDFKSLADEATIGLADFPDTPRTLARGSATPLPPSPPSGAEGIAATLRGDPLQYLGPGGAAQPLFVDIVMTQPASSIFTNPLDVGRHIKEVLIEFERSAVARASDGPVPGDVQVTGADPDGLTLGLSYKVPFAPGTTRTVQVDFTTDDDNKDTELNVVFRIRLQNGTVQLTSVPFLRARFFRARLSFARASDLKPIDDSAIRPAPVVDRNGQVVAPPAADMFHVELRAHDVGNTVAATVLTGIEPLSSHPRGSGNPPSAREHHLVLTRIQVGPHYALYRSASLVAHLEAPETYGVDQFPSASYERIWVGAPFTIAARVDAGVFPTNPNSVECWTPTRPVAALTIDRVMHDDRRVSSIQPVQPSPIVSLDLSTLGAPIAGYELVEPAYAVDVDANKKVTVRLKGSVRDPVADMLKRDANPGNPVKPVTLTVAGINVDLTSHDEPIKVLRPYAWRGDFETQVELQPGLNVIDVTATNLLGGAATRTLHIELNDARNDYANPDRTYMWATVRVLANREPLRRAETVLVHYHSPAIPQATTTTTISDEATVVLSSMGQAAQPFDQVNVTIKRDRLTTEQTWCSQPVLLVPDSVDVTAARALGLTVLRHRAGTRIDASATALPHAGGALDLHTAVASKQLEVRLRLERPAGTWQTLSALTRGDRFVIEARCLAPRPLTDMALTIAACDRMGRPMSGEGRIRRIYLKAANPPDPDGWLRMRGYLNDSLQAVNDAKADHLVAIGRDEQAPAGEGVLRIGGAASIRIGELHDAALYAFDPLYWSGVDAYVFPTLIRTDDTRAEARVSVNFATLRPDGTYYRADRLTAGDTFTIEASVTAYPYPPPAPAATAPVASFRGIELSVATFDPLHLHTASEDRLRRVLLAPDPASGTPATRYQLKSYLDSNLKWVDVTALKAVGGAVKAAAGEVGLRVFGPGSIVLGEALGQSEQFAWPVDECPVRQRINGVEITQDAARATSAMAGANTSVVVATGEFIFAEHDAGLHGRGLDCEIVRSYQSFADFDGPLGYGWNHSYNAWMQKEKSGDYTFVSGDGRARRFTRSTNGFDPPAGIYGKLVERSPREVRLLLPTGVVEIYAATNADAWRLSLAAIVDRSDNRVRLVHDQSGLLVQAIDPLLQRIYLRHNELGRITAASDATGRSWIYSYHSGADPTQGGRGDLQSVRAPIVTIGSRTYPAGKTRAYRYHVDGFDGPKRHKIAGIQDGRGMAGNLPELLTQTYDADGRIDEQTFDDDASRRAAGTLGKYTFRYDPSAPKTTVLDRKRHEKRFEFKVGAIGDARTLAERFIEVIPAAGTVPQQLLTTIHLYNDQREVIRVETPLGGATETTYNHAAVDPRERGQVLSVKHFPIPGRPKTLLQSSGINPDTEPVASQPDSIEWKWTYEPSDTAAQPRYQRIATATDPFGRVTKYVYDYDDAAAPTKRGNLARTEEPAVTAPNSAPTIVTRVRYNNFGDQIASIDANGVETKYEYYPASTPNGSGTTVGTTAAANARPGRLARVTEDVTPASVPRSASLAPPDPIITEHGYDVWGNPAWTRHGVRPTGAMGASNVAFVTMRFNELGQLVERVDAEGLREQFEHDENDMLARKIEHVIDLRFPPDVPAADRRTMIVVDDIEHDRLGRLTVSTVDATALALKHVTTFDANGNVDIEYSPAAKRAVNPQAKRYKKHVHDDGDRLVDVIHAPDSTQKVTRHFAYNGDGHLETVEDARGISIRHVYDAWGHLVAEVDKLKNAKRTAYDALGRIVRTQVTENYQDESNPGRVLVEHLIYRDEVGREIASVDKVFRYDGAGVLTTIGTGRRKTTFAHDAGGNIISTAHPGIAGAATVQFNGHGLPTRVDDPVTGVTTYKYDSGGNVTEVTYPQPADAGGGTISLGRTFDAMGRVLRAATASGGSVTYYYDSLGHQRLTEDPDGNRTFTEYDGAGRRTRVKRVMRASPLLTTWTNKQMYAPIDLITEWHYDENDNLLRVTRQNGAFPIVTHEYGDRDQRLSSTYPTDVFAFRPDPSAGPRVHTFEYWENGTLKSATAPDGVIVTHEYDDAARLQSRIVTPGSSGVPATRQTFTHDAAGRVLTAIDDDGVRPVEVRLAYDSLGNIWSDTQIVDGAARTFRATHNETGTLDFLEYPGGRPGVQYFRDGSGRVTAVWEREDGSSALVNGQPTGPANHLASYRFDKGYLTGRDAPKAGLAMDVHYHHNALVRERVHHRAAMPQSVLQGEAFDYEINGMPRRIVDLQADTERTIVYDSAARVIEVRSGKTASGATSVATAAANTLYDARGNVMRVLTGAVSSHDAATGALTIGDSIETRMLLNDADMEGQRVEMATAASGGAQTIQVLYYDKRGNLRDDSKQTYQFDAFNRLTKVTRGGVSTSFRFDALGRRVAKDGRRFSYYGTQLLDEDETSITGKRYLCSGSDVLALEFKGLNLRWYPHEDRNGSILALSDEQGQVFARYSYDQFGAQKILRPDGSEFTPPVPAPMAAPSSGVAAVTSSVSMTLSPFKNPLTHHRQYLDLDTGLYMVGSRSYHPGLQRFLQRDPLAELDTSAYAHAGNNSFSVTDPSGNIFFVAPLVIIVGTFLAAELVTAIAGPETGSFVAMFSPIHGALDLYHGYRVASVFSSYRGAELGTADKVITAVGVVTAVLGVGGAIRGVGMAARVARGARAIDGVLTWGMLTFGTVSSLAAGQPGWAAANIVMLATRRPSLSRRMQVFRNRLVDRLGVYAERAATAAIGVSKSGQRYITFNRSFAQSLLKRKYYRNNPMKLVEDGLIARDEILVLRLSDLSPVKTGSGKQRWFRAPSGQRVATEKGIRSVQSIQREFRLNDAERILLWSGEQFEEVAASRAFCPHCQQLLTSSGFNLVTNTLATAR